MKILIQLVGSCAVLTLIACSSPQLKNKEEEVKVVSRFKANHYVLKNGLKVIIVEDRTSPTFAYQTWFKVGSKDEKVGFTGLAHLFEHLMFKKTKNLGPGVFDKKIEQAGGQDVNAFTSQDYTAYVQELPSSELDLIAGLEAERMQNLIVDDEAFRTEVLVVQNERRMRNENSPHGIMYQTMYESAFLTHPYHWPVIGYEKDLNQMKAVDAYNFYQSYYTPNNATIIIVGDVNSDDAVKILDTHYGGIPNRVIPARNETVEIVQQETVRKTLPLNVQTQELFIAYKVPAADHPDSAAFEIIQALLTDGHGARMQKSMVDTGICSSISSGSLQHAGPGLFTIFASLQIGKSSDSAEAIITSELERLKTQLVSDDELNRAKSLARFVFYSGLTSNDNLANFIGRSELVFGDYRKATDLYEGLNSMTSEKIQAVAKKYFVPNFKTSVRGVPKG